MPTVIQPDAQMRLSAAKVRNFIETGQRSDRLIYYVGQNLGEEREKNRTLAAIADALYREAEKGNVWLFQKRYGHVFDGNTTYLAIRR